MLIPRVAEVKFSFQTLLKKKNREGERTERKEKEEIYLSSYTFQKDRCFFLFWVRTLGSCYS